MFPINKSNEHDIHSTSIGVINSIVLTTSVSYFAESLFEERKHFLISYTSLELQVVIISRRKEKDGIERRNHRELVLHSAIYFSRD